MTNRIFLALLTTVFSLSAFAQIDPIDKDPTLGSYVLNGPVGVTKFQPHQVSGPHSRTAKDPEIGRMTTVLPGDYTVTSSSSIFNFTAPLKIKAQTTTTVTAPAVAICGTFAGATAPLSTSFWNSPQTVAIETPDRTYNTLRSYLDLQFHDNAQHPATCDAPAYLAKPGHYSLALMFADDDDLKAFLPTFKPLAFDVKSAQLTQVIAQDEDLRSQIRLTTYGTPLYPVLDYQAEFPNPTCAGVRPQIYDPTNYIYMATAPTMIDFQSNQPFRGHLQPGAVQYVPATDASIYVWPLKPGAPAKYFVSVAGIDLDVTMAQPGVVKEIETKILNVNDVRISSIRPNTPDYSVPGTMTISTVDPSGAVRAASIPRYSVSPRYRSCDVETVQREAPLTYFKTKSSIELLPLVYEVKINYYHPEELVNKQQIWSVDCTTTGAQCRARLVSEGPVP